VCDGGGNVALNGCASPAFLGEVKIPTHDAKEKQGHEAMTVLSR